MKTSNEMQQTLLDKAASDADFRQRLLSNPKQAIKDEFDIAVTKGMEVHVHEASPEATHLVLPPAEALDEAQLEAVAGGHWLCQTHYEAGSGTHGGSAEF